MVVKPLPVMCCSIQIDCCQSFFRVKSDKNIQKKILSILILLILTCFLFFHVVKSEVWMNHISPCTSPQTTKSKEETGNNNNQTITFNYKKTGN